MGAATCDKLALWPTLPRAAARVDRRARAGQVAITQVHIDTKCVSNLKAIPAVWKQEDDFLEKQHALSRECSKRYSGKENQHMELLINHVETSQANRKTRKCGFGKDITLEVANDALVTSKNEIKNRAPPIKFIDLLRTDQGVVDDSVLCKLLSADVASSRAQRLAKNNGIRMKKTE
ncbi:hypothetical protein EJB05_08071, partial [Eragrostis curvula]